MSGRSLTAHHSVLIFEVLEATSLPVWEEDEEIDPTDHELLKELYSLWNTLNQTRMHETWHDAQQIREETLDRFSLGLARSSNQGQDRTVILVNCQGGSANDQWNETCF